MKYSVSSYSFASYIFQNKIKHEDTIKIAAELGFHAIEFVSFAPPEEFPSLDYARELKEMAKAEGIEFSCYTIGADFINGSGGDTSAEIERVKTHVDFAAELGVGFMRHDVAYETDGASFEEVLPMLADCCRSVAEYAKPLGVRTMVENHGYFCQASERLVALYKAVNHENFSLLCDIGNFTMVDENCLSACKAVSPYVAYVHAKDFVRAENNNPENPEQWFKSSGGLYFRGVAVGDGYVEAGESLRLLKSTGYDGFISIEYEGWEDAVQGISEGLEFIRNIFD